VDRRSRSSGSANPRWANVQALQNRWPAKYGVGEVQRIGTCMVLARRMCPGVEVSTTMYYLVALCENGRDIRRLDWRYCAA
jgi:hypothetical protein